MLKSKKIVSGALVLASVLATSTIGQAARVNINYYVNSGYSYNKYVSINSNYYNWQTIIIPTRPAKPSTPVVPEKPNQETPITPEKPTVPEVPTENEVPNTSQTLSYEESEVVRLVNIERTKMGLEPFTISSKLSDVARLKSQDMAVNNYFSHTSPTYGSPFDMMKKYGITYKTAGENIAKGYLSAQSVVNGWMNSAGHKANILNPSFKTIGVGAYKTSNNTIYWTQMFTN